MSKRSAWSRLSPPSWTSTARNLRNKPKRRVTKRTLLEKPNEAEKPHADFSKAKMGPLGPKAYEAVQELLYECRAFFPADLKVVNIISGKEVSTPLYDENATPVACKAV